MFALEHVGVKHNRYENRSAAVCSLAQTPRHLSEELKAVSDALSVFQESVPTPWRWQKSQPCQAAHGGGGASGAQCTGLSRDPVLPVPMLELNLYHQLGNHVFSFLLLSSGSSAWLDHYSPLTTSPFNFIPSHPCAQCCFWPGRLNFALCTVKPSGFW